MKLRDVLNIKDFKYRKLITVGPDATVAMAIEKLVDHDKGALPVCNEKGELAGIITERDIVRKCIKQISDFLNVKVKDVMTTQVTIGNPDDELDYNISVMKQKRIRHLPIVEGHKTIGMISMRDLLRLQLEETKAEILCALLIGRAHPGRPRFL